MIRYCAVGVEKGEDDGGKLLIMQRVHLFERAHNKTEKLTPRKFEFLAAPAVLERHPTGKIIGWFDSFLPLYNSSDVEVSLLYEQPPLGPPLRV